MHLIVRANSLEKGMSDYLVQQIRNPHNIDARLNPEIVGGKGKERLETLMIQDKKRKKIDTIPAIPLDAQRDAKGFIVTGQNINLNA